MGVSIFRIAEQARVILEKRVSIQVLIPAVIDAYGFVAKKIWYENTAFDEMNVDGSFINTFKDVMPILDLDRDMYYVVIPSTYLILPHQMGVKSVSFMKDRKNFVVVSNWGTFKQLKASVFGGRQVVEIEGNRMWLPKMVKIESHCPLLIKLAIAYDNIDPNEEINIGPNVINDIINIVVAPYMNKQNPTEKIREIIN